MKPIVSELTPGASGPDVANLQDALAFILRQNIFGLSEGDRDLLLRELGRERDASVYRDATAKIVGIFQNHNGLEETREVRSETARVMNDALARLGAFDDQQSAARGYVVAGRVTDNREEPFARLRVSAYHAGDRGLLRLGVDESDQGGFYTIRFDEFAGIQQIELVVEAVDADGHVVAHSERQPMAQQTTRVDLTADRPAVPSQRNQLHGVVVLDTGAPATELSLRLYRLEFGGRATKLGDGTTGPQGEYALTFDDPGSAVTVVVRAANSAGAETTLSKVLAFAADATRLQVDLVAPASLHEGEAEYTRLAAALTPHVGAIATLAEARENDQRRDLTALHSATGWDARPIALAATAQKLETDPSVKLRADALYGLFRAGLPHDKSMLAHVDPDDVATALTKLAAKGIVTMTAGDIEDFTEKFQNFAKEVRLAVPAPGSQTTYAELLQAAEIDGGGDTFADVFLKHRGDGKQLWQAAREADVPDVTISKLQWQGKLAFLSGNSGKVTKQLMSTLEGAPLGPGGAVELKSPVELVGKDLYDADQWKVQVRSLAADDDELAAIIPAAYNGKTLNDRLDAYAADMARKIRLSYPTEVVTRLIETDKIELNGSKDATVKLLRAVTPQGFTLGQSSIEQFMSTGATVRDSITASEVQMAKNEIKKLQRVYQITPTNESMQVLKALNLESAFDVTALGENDFYQLYDKKYAEVYGRFPTQPEKNLVWRKAQQVSSMTYTIFGVAKKLDTDLAVQALAGGPERVAADRTSLSEALVGYPTMQQLFGSMDFCECTHCQSVLSPAAYLVDLLQYVEAEPQARANFLAGWLERNGTAYADNGYRDPYDELIARRPDLPHIELTCENTNVALPYIDIVNEILEYYLAHGNLAKAAAHDTGDATTAELLAEPQNIVVDAYKILHDEKFPLSAPFDLWLETVREFCAYAETPLYRVLETFRSSEGLLADGADFGWAGIFVESLGLSPATSALFINENPLADWWTLYGYADQASAVTEATKDGERVDLNSARALAGRLGVTYKELVSLVSTTFGNPGLATMGILLTLPASIAELRTFREPANQTLLADNRDLLGADLTKEQQARVEALTDDQWSTLTNMAGFDDRVAAYALAYGRSIDEVLAELNALDLGAVLVLADPDSGCSFDKTILRYADGSAADPETFLRLNLFVRLWRALGWSIEEIDRALAAFIPTTEPYANGHFDKKPLRTALIYVAHLKVLDEHLKVGKPSRLRLLTLWTDIPTRGRNSLYRQLFLTRSVLKADRIFDHPNDDYLAPEWVAAQGLGKPAEFVLIKGHLPAIQSALGLTAQEVAEILQDADADIQTAPLTIGGVSVLHRYGVLAKALRLSIHDLITLKTLSGKNPFAPLTPIPLTGLDDDAPYVETLAFVDMARMVKQSGFSISDVDFLLRRHFDESGPRTPDRPTMLALLTTLADGVRTIRRENGVPGDFAAITEEFLQQKLGQLLSPVDAAMVLRMIRGEVDVTAASTEAFFNAVLKKQQVRLADDAGFLDAADFPGTFTPLDPLKTIEPDDSPEAVKAKRAENEAIIAANQAKLLDRRTRVVTKFMPVLQSRLIRQLVTQTLAAESGTEPQLVERLVTDAELLSVNVTGLGNRPLVEAFAAAAKDGIGADFFASTDGGGERQDTPTCTPAADTTLRPDKTSTGTPLPPANSARFHGYVAARTTGPCRFFINLEKAGAEARLIFEHLPNPIFLESSAAVDHAEFGTGPDEYVELKAAVPYEIRFELDGLSGGDGKLTVQGQTTPRGPLSQFALYPASGVEAAEKAYILLRSALELVEGLSLTLREIIYIAGHPANWGDVDLSTLPTEPATAADMEAATKRFAWLMRLLEYASLRRDLAGATDALIDVFESVATDSEKSYERLGALSRREVDVVRATAETVLQDAEQQFADDRPVLRLWNALVLVERFGAPAARIKEWTRIVAPVSGPGPVDNIARFEIARGIKETIKARFDPETWQLVAQPIFDRLRKKQRDALTAAIMHRNNLSSLEQLYEYFLVDPGMEPVVQTSRIRLGIASVQLFIQRALLNLEPHVPPSAILNVEQWDWMKRYRVWEANRKIFLFPENWLEPEFRDDKTHLFKDLESALVKDDVSAEVAEDAFLVYLNRLAALAKLEMVAMHLEAKPDFAKNTLHVFGRTHSIPHQYFYRRYANRMWTPWEPVAVEIEGDHLAPVAWRNRLYLFWVTFTESGKNAGGGPANANDLTALPVTKRDVEAQLHWSEYINGEWQTPESGGYQPPKELRVRAENLDSFDAQKVFVHVAVIEQPDIGAETTANLKSAGVYINLAAPFNKAFHLASRHSAPRSSGASASPSIPFGCDTTPARRRPTSYVGAGGKLTVSFRQRIITGPGQVGADVAPQAVTVLDSTENFSILPVNNRISLGVSTDAVGEDEDDAGQQDIKKALEATIGEIESLIKPVFFQDQHQVLFIEPEVNERTIGQWEEWVTRTPVAEPDRPGWQLEPDFWDKYVIPLYAGPQAPGPADPRVKFSFHESVLQPGKGTDWLVNSGTALLFDGKVIGGEGLASVDVVSVQDVRGLTAQGGVTISVNAGSGVGSDTAVVVKGSAVAAGTSLTQLAAGLNIVGGAGLNSTLRQSVDSFKSQGLSGMSGRVGFEQ